MKTCTKCKESKSIDCFTVRRASKDGLSLVCRDCWRNYSREKYHSSPEFKVRALERARQWAKGNREKRKKIVNECYHRNLEENRKKGRDQGRARRENNPEKARLAGRIAAAIRKGRVNKSEGELDQKHASLLLKMARGKCIYCDKPSVSLTLDHLSPISKKGSLSWDNIIPCCKSCNSSKGDRDSADWVYKRYGIDGLARTLLFMKAAKMAMKRLYGIVIEPPMVDCE